VATRAVLELSRWPSAYPACEVDPGSRVARAGLPVIERLAEDLGELAVGVELTDERGGVIRRVVGARGLASTRHRGTASVAAPITDPRRAVPVGAVGVSCAIPDAGALMLPYAQLAARAISERMVDGGGVADRELLEQFLRARSRARGPVFAVNENELFTNAAAARLVRLEDHAHIWKWAINAVDSNELTTCELHVGTHTVSARCEPLGVGSVTVGVLVHIQEVTPASTATVAAWRVGSTGRRKVGWESLRSSELGIAELVAEGLTNRQIAARIFVSPHTVDFHLRQIFRKLSITSRIELTRQVVEHAGPSSRTAIMVP
jgi:DNA-binding CsgD family transcriptional regulator